MCLAQEPQHSDAGEARTRGPSVSVTLPLSHHAPYMCGFDSDFFPECKSKSISVCFTHCFRLMAFKCERGPFFQVANLNGNLTQFRPSEIHYLRDPTARNGSLHMGQLEM